MSNLFDYLHELISNKIHPTLREEEIWQRYGRKVAVMVVASSGFSRVTKQEGILHFLSQLMLMRKVIQSVCETHRAHMFRFEADNVYAAFDHPDDAIRTALQVHEAIKGENLMLTDSEPFTVCIGVGFGDMLYSETLEGYFGEEMNLASKLGEDTATAGETLLTHSAFEHASDELTRPFTRGRICLAGIESPCHRHQFEG